LQLKFYLKFKNKEDLSFTEQPYPFFDLKRSGTADGYYLFQNQAGTVQIFCGLFQARIERKSNLQPQNTGY
jgi:hypothetical protein